MSVWLESSLSCDSSSLLCCSVAIHHHSVYAYEVGRLCRRYEVLQEKQTHFQNTRQLLLPFESSQLGGFSSAISFYVSPLYHSVYTFEVYTVGEIRLRLISPVVLVGEVRLTPHISSSNRPTPPAPYYSATTPPQHSRS